ncbi:MAG: MarR family transcriptional regulator [Patescibacteria group bacterium]|nr:MarR family transcriptional regulator [Patescibacteria group bacterium]
MANKGPKYNLEELLLLFKRSIRDIIKKEGFKDDLTFSQVEVLRFVGLSGKRTMKNIADYLKITPPSASQIISEMEKKNLIKRKSDENDRRVVFIILSDKAKKLFTSLSDHKDAVFEKMISKLNGSDRKTLERIIRILITE